MIKWLALAVRALFNMDVSKSIRSFKNKHRSTVYVFLCDCGNEMNILKSKFESHSGKCISCCQKKRPYEYILNELSRRRNKKYPVDLTYDEFLEIIKDKKCFYCDKYLIYNEYSRDKDGEKVSRAHQLDRKDNSIGYTKDNLVSCCWDCNRIKSNIYSYEEFLLLSPILKQINKKRKDENKI
jgi:hypothetical protein